MLVDSLRLTLFTITHVPRLVIEGELRKEGAVQVPAPSPPPSAAATEASNGGSRSATGLDHYQSQPQPRQEQQKHRTQDGNVMVTQAGPVTAGAVSSTNGGVGSGGANGGSDGGAAVCPLALISLGKGRWVGGGCSGRVLGLWKEGALRSTGQDVSK